ncbi:uncharacterized protein [Temnothorax longispinosus]|uniref:uncharacterized protein n=1 Tax=Temnothorax longispinosus TaxID=300112 RepID=UPI003A995852
MKVNIVNNHTPHGRFSVEVKLSPESGVARGSWFVARERLGRLSAGKGKARTCAASASCASRLTSHVESRHVDYAGSFHVRARFFAFQLHEPLHLYIKARKMIIIGITGGVTFPACHTMVAKWAPPHERARFIWSLLGGTFGTILTYLMIAGIAETLNWESGWYVVPSLLMLMWVCVWALVAYDSLREHLMGITVEEKDYILTAQAGTVRPEKPRWKQTQIENMMCQYDSLFKSASRYPYISRVPTGEKNLCFVYQFVKNAIRYSISNLDTFYTVNYISGPPTYFPKYGNFPKTFMARKYSYDIAISSWRANVPWDPYTDHVTNINDKGINYIELEFHEHVYPIRVSIYEVYHPGLIIKIWAQDSQNKWFPLWEGSPQILPLSQESRLFSPPLQSCNFKTNRLRLEF